MTKEEALKAAREALDRIAGFTLSQFMGPHDMAFECVNVAASALAKIDAALAEQKDEPSAQQDEAATIEAELPHAYLFAKLAMVMPLFQEARDALTAITELQRVAHRISSTLADRMDTAGTYSIDDWNAAQQ
jgi:hypothetical protein